jgi:hypothetical protein
VAVLRLHDFCLFGGNWMGIRSRAVSQTSRLRRHRVLAFCTQTPPRSVVDRSAPIAAPSMAVISALFRAALSSDFPESPALSPMASSGISEKAPRPARTVELWQPAQYVSSMFRHGLHRRGNLPHIEPPVLQLGAC